MLKKIETSLDIFEKKSFLTLIIIISCGLAIRIFFTPWHLPTNSFDGYLLVIEGLDYSRNDFSNLSNRFMWPFFLSIFFRMVNFETYFDYVNIARILSIIISSVTVPIIYIIAKEFVRKKFALIASALFVIEPNLIENSIFGITESLFIFLGLLSFYFIIQKNQKYHIISFALAALAFDTRLNGIVLIFLIIISFIIQRKQENKKQILVGMAIFIVIIFPAHFLVPIQDNINPFPIVNNLIKTVSNGELSYSTFESSNSMDSKSILLNAMKNEFLHIFRISIPYLIFFVPIGMIISLKTLNFQNKMLFFAIIISLIIAIPQYTMSNEYRNLFFLIPFFCIFSVIGIQEMLNKVDMKNIFLIMLLLGLILLSGNFLKERYDIDESYYLEKNNFAKYIVENYEGKITGDLRLEIIQNIPNLRTGNYFYNNNITYFDPGVPINTVEELIEYTKQNKIDYLVIEQRFHSKHFPIFNNVISDEKEFPFLTKVFESEDIGYKKINIKIFKIQK